MERPGGGSAPRRGRLLLAAHANPALDVAAQLRRWMTSPIGWSRRTRGRCAGCCSRQLGLRVATARPLRRSCQLVHRPRPRSPPGYPDFVVGVADRDRSPLWSPLEGVGMPGISWFAIRRLPVLDRRLRGRSAARPLGLRATLPRRHRRPGGLTPEMLAATGPRTILARMLANLDRSFERRADHRSLLWVATVPRRHSRNCRR